MKIWGRSNSINVMKVLWGLGELGLPFERIDVGGAFGKTDTADLKVTLTGGQDGVQTGSALVALVSDSSGHYQPAQEHMDQLMRVLEIDGSDAPNALGINVRGNNFLAERERSQNCQLRPRVEPIDIR